MSLPAEAAAVILSREAPGALLIEFHFASETKRAWTGFGKVRTLDAREWDGLGEIISIDGLSPSFSASAPPGRIVASGVSNNAFVQALQASAYRDRLVSIYLQVFQGRALYGNPAPLATRVMKTLEFSRDAGTRVITLTHESPYTGRRRPAAAWFSDRDQQKRHPGDRFCERVPYYRFQRVQWPHYS